MQWTSHFFEVVIVASCNEYLSLPKKKKKKKKKKHGEPRLVEKLSSRQKEQDQASLQLVAYAQ